MNRLRLTGARPLHLGFALFFVLILFLVALLWINHDLLLDLPPFK
jgi:hypothetical protein